MRSIHKAEERPGAEVLAACIYAELAVRVLEPDGAVKNRGSSAIEILNYEGHRRALRLTLLALPAPWQQANIAVLR